MTITTVGYDPSPKTFLGKLIGKCTSKLKGKSNEIFDLHFFHHSNLPGH